MRVCIRKYMHTNVPVCGACMLAFLCVNTYNQQLLVLCVYRMATCDCVSCVAMGYCTQGSPVWLPNQSVLFAIAVQYTVLSVDLYNLPTEISPSV